MRISQIATYIKRGITPSYVEENGLAVVNQKCIQKGQVSYDFIKYTDKDKRYTEEKKVCAGDVLINSTGAGTMGRVAYVEAGFTFSYVDSHVTILRCRDYNAKFLFYWLRTLERYIESLGKGATNQLELSADAIAGIEIPDIDVDKQNAVVAILSSYDNLIDNNRRQIVLLEEAAQRLYREWFVDLRFPNYENTKIIDGVPEGWSRKTVSDCLKISIGGGWGKETPIGKNIISGKVIRGTDINNVKSSEYANIPLRYHTENDIQRRTLQVNDIVFELSNGNIDNIGRSLLIDDTLLDNCGENTICASFCKLLRPLDRLHALLLYLEVQDMNESGRMMVYKKQGSNGINNFAFNEFLSHEFLVPNELSHIELIEKVISKVSIVREQQFLLKQARDRLLPKLMSGEIAV